jgi:hypothetical protein
MADGEDSRTIKPVASSRVGEGKKVDNNDRPPDHQSRVDSRLGGGLVLGRIESSQESRGKGPRRIGITPKKKRSQRSGRRKKQGGLMEKSSDLWGFENRDVLGLHDHWWAHVDDLIMEGGKPVDVEE